MLILGELNDTETRRAGPRTIPAVPYAPAREILLRELSGNASDAQQIAALIGLQRHAKLLAATDNADSEIVRRMVDIVRAQPAAGTANVDALRWKQRLAVETLGLIGQPGAAPILEPIVLDDSLPLSLRVAAAKSLGQLEYADAGNLNTANLLKGLGQVALSACRDEMQRMKSRPADESNADMAAPPVPIIGGETIGQGCSRESGDSPLAQQSEIPSAVRQAGVVGSRADRGGTRTEKHRHRDEGGNRIDSDGARRQAGYDDSDQSSQQDQPGRDTAGASGQSGLISESQSQTVCGCQARARRRTTACSAAYPPNSRPANNRSPATV